MTSQRHLTMAMHSLMFYFVEENPRILGEKEPSPRVHRGQ